jgi:hypothetical protein
VENQQCHAPLQTADTGSTSLPTGASRSTEMLVELICAGLATLLRFTRILPECRQYGQLFVTRSPKGSRS